MDIILRPQSEEPLYKQIYGQIVSQIADGSLANGEALPSVRSAARYLGVAIITVKTAYEELEKDGFIYTVPAKGCFVSSNAAQVAEQTRVFAEKACEDFLTVCKKSGLKDEDILSIVKEQLRR
ncbi:MAG: GntR family transcriptional regulator [Clostridia bacterium]|nr:GntR family transcriptional regulator [Clostridia bacterium]